MFEGVELAIYDVTEGRRVIWRTPDLGRLTLGGWQGS
jgi:hypothetical protein